MGIQLFEDEARAKAQITEQVGISERKAAALSGEVEESKALLDGSNRSIRQLQNDVADSRAAVNNMQTINGRDMTSKRQLESSIHTLQAEVDGMLVAAKNAEDKAKKAMVDAARLADELRAEQEHVSTLGTGKNSLSNALGELEGRLSDAENAALKGGKTAMAKLEGEINELEIGLDHANKANSEGIKSIKRYQTQLRETIQAFEDEARSRAQIAEQVGISERKAGALSGEVEESKALLDGANRSIRQLQNDIADSRAAVNNMQTINGRDMTSKRQLESSIHTLQAEVDGMLVAAKNAEDKAKKAMVDAARLADELRAEQDHAT